MNKIVIAGGAGFLGQVVARHFARKGWQVVILSRDISQRIEFGTRIQWDGKTCGIWTRELEDASCLLNLCGKSVNCRYTATNRKRILSSRIEPTLVLSDALQRAENPPPVWLNASSATIYRQSHTEPMDERGGIIGDGFSVEVCQAWENALFQRELTRTRRVALRTSMVLGQGRNSVFPVLARLVRCGLGGGFGKGDQLVSWIHEQDFVRAVELAIDDERIEGPLNVTAPAAVSNRIMMRILRETLHVPLGLRQPKPILEVGAFLLRTESELMLKSRFAFPGKLLENRFVFRFPFIDEAFTDLVTGQETVLGAPDVLSGKKDKRKKTEAEARSGQKTSSHAPFVE